MQDRFKFRHFNKLVKKMTYYDNPEMQVCLNGDFKSDIIFPMSEEIEGNAMYMGNYENLQQCTGLKDKNGELIYEGDIVKITKENWKQEISHRFYIICWDRTQWQLGLIKYQRPKAQPNRRPDRKIHFKNIVSFADYTPLKEFAQCEIIGNIYENPELLKEN